MEERMENPEQTVETYNQATEFSERRLQRGPDLRRAAGGTKFHGEAKSLPAR